MSIWRSKGDVKEDRFLSRTTSYVCAAIRFAGNILVNIVSQKRKKEKKLRQSNPKLSHDTEVTQCLNIKGLKGFFTPQVLVIWKISSN